MSPPIRLRAEAREAGAKTYFTGKPCKRGHVSERRTVSSVCIDCETPYQAERHQRLKNDPTRKAQQKAATRAWVIRNPEKISARNRRQRQKDPAKTNRQRRDWARKNPEAARRIARKKREKNPGNQQKASKAWALRNPEAAIVRAHRRRDRVKANGGTVSAKEIADILHCQNGLCASCGAGGKLHLDHIMPLKRGGRHEAANLQWLCKPCNLSKAARAPEEWAKYKEEIAAIRRELDSQVTRASVVKS